MGGSGGGGSGAPPGYLQEVHLDWLVRQTDGQDWDKVDTTMAQLVNEAVSPGGNPFFGIGAYSPRGDLEHMWELLETYRNDVFTFDDVYTEDIIEKEIEAFRKIQQFDLETGAIPTFTARTRQLGAVFTSYYTQGLGIILQAAQRDADKFSADLISFRAKSAQQWRADCIKALAHYGIEVTRMTIASMHDYTNQTLNIEEGMAEWPFKAFQHGANLMASVTGGTSITPSKQGSPITSAVGGAFQGMSVGAQFGSMFANGADGDYSGYGSIIGGVVGAIGGAVQ